MCYPFDAQPPEAPGAAGEIQTADTTLTAADGTPFAAFNARPAQVSTVGVVVLPDVRGLFPFYEELARGFARQGINAVAIDYFGRTAGVGKRDAEFSFMEHVFQTTAAGVSADAGAAVNYLRSPAGGGCSSVFTIGFCFGGAASWNQAANGHGLAGAIGFYGWPGPGFKDAPPANPFTDFLTNRYYAAAGGPLQRASEIACPILALMGGADPSIPVAQVEEFRAALDHAAVPNEVVIYPGAPHSFFDRSYKEHADASADAWRRVLGFVRTNAG